jgi:hypothetical protein
VLIFATVGGTGGIQTNVRGFARFLLLHGCAVQIFSSRLHEDTAGERSTEENADLETKGAKIVTLEPKPSLPARRFRTFAALSHRKWF